MTAATNAPSDMELVRAFVKSKDHDAFAQLVRRHVDMVYATALRRVRDNHLADDVTQATFIILARRAHAFDERTLVGGWLHRAAGYAASNALKIEARRRAHERRAAENAMMCVNETNADDDRWGDVEPLIDAAVDQLGEAERAAVVMRFHQDKSVDETASALGVSTEAAKKRLQRALAKLRSILARQGVKLPTTAALATTIASHASAARAPADLAGRATSAALDALAPAAAVVAAAGSTPLLISKGALSMMLWTKLKLAALVGAVVIVLAGAGALAVSRAGSSGASRQVEPPRYIFGDVVERVVNDDGLRKDETIDFDTGKLHTGPARSLESREEGRKWFRSTGADAHGETEEGETGLFAVEMAVLPIDNEMWDTGDAEELRDMIADGPGATPLMSGDGDLPQTYLFRTREGGIGLCQLLEVKRDDQQHGTIRIHYKLIKPAR